jgi:hypothetical protein
MLVHRRPVGEIVRDAVTEADWNSSQDPQAMLAFLRDSRGATDRKLRLLALACCSPIWHLLSEESRQLVRAVESYAEGRATRHDRDAAVATFRKALGWSLPATSALRAAYATKAMTFDCWLAASVAGHAALASADASPEGTAFAAERAAQSALIRCLFSQPFRPVSVLPDWLAWNAGTVRRLAEAAYNERVLPAGTLDPARLAVLADALEEAGCHDQEVLTHLREPGVVHVRGCHVVDLILGKS